VSVVVCLFYYALLAVVFAAALVAPIYLALAVVSFVVDRLRRVMPRREVPAGLRTTDRARARAVAALGESYAEGRLDLTELERRNAAALGARTSSELAVLFADLPRPRPPDGGVRVREVVAGVVLLLLASPPARIVGAFLVLAAVLPALRVAR